jgi:copper homeostasis protein (lipoprotein)
MKNRILIIVTLLVFSCDSPSEEKKYEETTATSPSDEKEIILENRESTWVYYTGVLPCADCSGIKTELRLENSPEKLERTYELTETYLETPDGDRKFVTSGIYEVIYGLEDKPGAMAIRLLDQESMPSKSFLQDQSGKLTLLDQQENPIESDLNYTLEMVTPQP